MRFLACCLCLTGILFGTSLAAPRYVEKYISLPVDHFSYENERTFNLRYLIDNSLTNGSPNAPILFYCGNEANIEHFASFTGFMWELAAKINALIVFGEHRYYGKSVPPSHPSDNENPKFRYLTIEQTLADFAGILNHITNGTSRPIIAIGGSYGGVLAALFRIKYPNLVAGALASSAPLRQFSNMTACEKYTQVITNVFRLSNNEFCATNIKKSWSTLNELASTAGGVDFFNEVFGFCTPWTRNQVNELIGDLDNFYWHLAMTNYPYEAVVYSPLPANPVRKFCSHLDQDYSGHELVKALRRALEIFNYKGENKCFKFPHSGVMKPSDSAAWYYQTCTELLTPFCDRDHSMFPTGGGTYTEKLNACKAEFGEGVMLAANRIKNHFGVDDLKHVTNIIFSNGLLDPWSAASILTAPNNQTVVINIPDGAHHIDLRHSNELDPPSVTNARRLEQVYIKKWIRAFRRNRIRFM